MAEHWNGGTGGKGSKARPFSVTQEEYDNRWDLIFGKDKPEEDKKVTRNNEETQQALGVVNKEKEI